ncbi:aminotransferase class I/II-fold pyridoxal phosphate-dependent enzyme [Flavobacteriales bacterium]|jgi:glycine C-acetyltransferase|nr:aminotransferase class I/II-fold pyridoxal phosphate-dependent enzyme [Flavobacteriales bacterium]
MTDLFDKIAKGGELGRYRAKTEGYFMFPKLEGELAPRMNFNGKEVLNWSLNNYLGLGNHPEIRKADAQATADWGLAYPMGSRMMSGNTKYHEQLEDELAEFVQKDAGLVVNFGYQAIASCVDALVDRHDVIVYDQESHACIIDGVRMHQGKRYMFKHNDMESLEKNLKRAEKLAKETGGGILVISEGVFGMRGDQGKLKEIMAFKEQYKFRILVDDAHGFGVLGETGFGTGEEQGVQDDIDVYFATFAKSMAGIGGFIAGNKDIIDFLKYNLRSQVYAKSLPMPFVIGALKRLDMMRGDMSFKNKLWENVNLLQNGLKDRGFEIGTTNSCVTPVYMKGSLEEATHLAFDLRENHRIFCSIVVYPVIPKGMIIFRLIPTASHSEADVVETLDAFEVVAKKLADKEYDLPEMATFVLQDNHM